MHKKYAKDGLVIVTVDIDVAVDARATLPEIQKKVAKLVTAKELSPLVNLILDEPEKVLQDKLHYASTPIVYVFNKEGKWRRFEDEAASDHAAIEKLVVKLLQAK
jgi:hypothetical protein